MPWNDNSNGGNNNGGGGPWGPSANGSGGKDDGPKNPWGGGNNPPPRRPGSVGPSGNLDDLAKKVEDRLKSVLGGGGSGGGFNGRGSGGSGSEPIQFDRRAMGAIALVAVLGWFSTGVYVVNAGEEAVIQRFGKYVRTVGPGLQFHMPVPIETHVKVDVQRSRSLSVGSAGEGSAATDGLMLTGDQNIVDVGFQVNWRVENSRDFLFQVAHAAGANNRADPQTTVRAVAEAAIREVVGRSQRDQVLATGRAQVETQTRELIQRTLNQYRAGISISEVNLTKAEPPAAVNEAFREVAAASQEAETKINQARSYRNAVVPQAQGEAARFNQLYQEYKLAPDVTRQRLYLETMEKIYERANKVVIDPGKGGTAPMMVLPPELFRGGAPAAPVASPNNAAPASTQGAGR